jgi:choline monooxygenase
VEHPIQEILAMYDDRASLPEAHTIPAPWYFDPRIAELERHRVFSRTWQAIGRSELVAAPGQFITANIAGEPIVAVRGTDNILRAFFNVCRHHAAAVATEPCGVAQQLRCPYHGWTYGLDGALKGMTEFEGVQGFDRAQNGLVPIRVAEWEKFVFVNFDPAAEPLESYLGTLVARAKPLSFKSLKFFERRSYEINCNWKVYIDNFLDGGYHVPHAHKALNSALQYTAYTIENEGRLCIQASPLKQSTEDSNVAATRTGDMAYYYWLYPNFMLNWYEGYLDTNLVLPLGVDRCLVIFDFYFAETEGSAQDYNNKSIAVSHRVQEEDIALCDAVQRGLNSQAYIAGRLSVRREAGEHLFHRLLAADLKSVRTAVAR